MIRKIGKMKNASCNKTHLDIEKAADRGIIHRDYLAHSLRWTHVMKYLKPGMSVLDVGCASAMLAQVAYVNKMSIDYTGVDIRLNQLEIAAQRKLKNELDLVCMDITEEPFSSFRDDSGYDIVTCFEVLEHIPESSLDHVLSEISSCLHDNSKCFISTPNYNGKDKAANHIHEYEMNELMRHLVKYFKIVEYFGTFASMSDIEPVLSVHEQYCWSKLKRYYDSNVFSVLFAPMHPRESRNILWHLEKI